MRADKREWANELAREAVYEVTKTLCNDRPRKNSIDMVKDLDGKLLTYLYEYL